MKKDDYSYQNSTSSYNNTIVLAPGDYLFFRVMPNSNSGSVSVTITFSQNNSQYVLDTLCSAYNWSYGYYLGYNGYASTNSGINSSSSTMKIKFLAAGTFNFSYYAQGERYHDYLSVKKNDTEVLSTYNKNQDIENYTDTSITVSQGDVLTFTFLKDSTVHSGNDYAAIKINSFVIS